MRARPELQNRPLTESLPEACEGYRPGLAVLAETSYEVLDHAASCNLPISLTHAQPSQSNTRVTAMSENIFTRTYIRSLSKVKAIQQTCKCYPSIAMICTTSHTIKPMASPLTPVPGNVVVSQMPWNIQRADTLSTWLCVLLWPRCSTVYLLR